MSRSHSSGDRRRIRLRLLILFINIVSRLLPIYKIFSQNRAKQADRYLFPCVPPTPTAQQNPETTHEMSMPVTDENASVAPLCYRLITVRPIVIITVITKNPSIPSGIRICYWCY